MADSIDKLSGPGNSLPPRLDIVDKGSLRREDTASPEIVDKLEISGSARTGAPTRLDADPRLLQSEALLVADGWYRFGYAEAMKLKTY